MRKHDVKCSVEGDKRNINIQYSINYYAILYIKKAILESGLPREEQMKIIEELLKKIKTRNTEDNFW